MSDLSDYQFQSGSSSHGVSNARRSAVVAAIALVIAIGAGYFVFLRGPRTGEKPAAATEPAAPAPAAVPNPLGAAAEPISLPPLADTDPLVRRLAGALSSHPLVAAWLATSGLIRSFVVVVENVSDGPSPAKYLRVLRPAQPFRVMNAQTAPAIDPQSFARYNSLADAVSSVDAAGSARLYATLKPRIEEAYSELGRQESFDRAVERAIVALLRVPVLTGTIRLEPSLKGIGYRYADPRLEGLTAAQKQLLRTGPRNTMIIQAKLREIALALGIPASRLPTS
jgi:hypothetical protein